MLVYSRWKRQSIWLYVRCLSRVHVFCVCVVCFQAEDGIRDLVRSRGLGDVYKRQVESGVVDHHDVPVRGHLHVALNQGDPVLDRTVEGLSLIHI